MIIESPSFTKGKDAERLAQIESYLHRMAQQLQWAFDTLETGGQAAPAVFDQRPAEGPTSPQETFASIKNLIIKSADIVDAYSEEINRKLSGSYVAKSEFGTYQQQTTQQIQANSTSLQQVYTNAQELSELVDHMHATVTETSAYIKTGLLDHEPDGTPVYGLEIGQRNTVSGQDSFDRFARFTAGRLSFFDQNGAEVAYVSDYKLYITNAEVTGALQLSGRFKVHYDHGLVFKWIGGAE